MGKYDTLNETILGTHKEFGLSTSESCTASLLGSLMLIHTTGIDFSRRIIIVESILEVWRRAEELSRKGEI